MRVAEAEFSLVAVEPPVHVEARVSSRQQVAVSATMSTQPGWNRSLLSTLDLNAVAPKDATKGRPTFVLLSPHPVWICQGEQNILREGSTILQKR